MAQRVRRSFFGGRGIAQADSRPWCARGLSNLVSRTLPIRGRYTETEVLQAIVSAPPTWAAVPTASSPPTISYSAASNDTPDTTKLGGVAWKRYWFRGDNGQIEGTGGGRTLLQRADFESSQVQGPVFGGGVNYNNNSGNSTEWWVNYQGFLRRYLNAGSPDTQPTGDIGDFSPWGWGFTLTGRGFAFNGQSFTKFVVYVEESGVLKRCPYQNFARGDAYAYVDFGTSATRNILLLIEPDSWSSEVLIPTSSTMSPWSGWRANKLTYAFMGDSYLQAMNLTDGCAFSEQLALLAGGHPATHVSAQGGTGYSSDNQDSSLRPFQFAHRLNRLSTPQPDVIDFRGGINDGWPTSLVAGGGTSDTAQAIDKTLQTARFDNPSALLVVGSPWAPNGPAGQTVGGKYQLLNNYLQAALARDPGPWIFIDSLNGTWKTSKGTQRTTAEGPWITGTGNTGAPNGSGNADIYITDDGTHFSDPGRRYGAEKNGQYMHDAAASMLAGTTYNLSASDAVAAADGSGTVAVGSAAASDAAAAGDGAGSQAAMAASASDAVTTGDSASAPASFAVAASDVVAPADVATSAGATAASTTDSVTANDVASVLSAAGVAAVDVVAAADSANGTAVVTAAATDAVTPGDGSSATSVMGATAADAAAAGDSGTAQMTRPSPASDAVSASDAAAAQAVQASTAVDAAAAIDVAQALSGGTLLAIDAVSAGDAAGAQAVRPMPVTDGITATDIAGAAAVLQLAAADGVSATDAALTQAVRAVLAAEVLTVADAALAAGSFGLAVAEVFALTDLALAVAQSSYVFVRDERTYRIPPEHRVLRVLPENRTFKANK